MNHSPAKKKLIKQLSLSYEYHTFSLHLILFIIQILMHFHTLIIRTPNVYELSEYFSIQLAGFTSFLCGVKPIKHPLTMLPKAYDNIVVCSANC